MASLTLKGQYIAAAFTGIAATATPTLVQEKQSYTDQQATRLLGGTNAYIFTCLPNAGLAGNTIIARVRSNTAPSTVTDNASETYTLAKSETAGSVYTSIYYFSNISAGAQCVSTTWSAGSGVQGDQIKLYEYANLATTSPVDVSCSATVTSGTAPACGSMTTTLANDLVMSATDVVTFSSTPTGSMSFTAQTGAAWAKLDDDGTAWTGTQAEILATAGAVNPTITVSQAVTRANVVGVAFKAASSGSIPSTGVHVNNIMWSSPQFGFSNSFATTTFALSFPSSGNALWLLVAAEDNVTLSGVTDTNSNTFTCLARVDSSGDSFFMQWCHADSATTNATEKMTITWSAAPSFVYLEAVDISRSAGYDTSATCGAGSTPCAINASSTALSGSIPGAVITPSTTKGVILSNANEDFQSVGTVNVGSFVVDEMFCPGTTGGCQGGGTGTFQGYQGSGMEQDSGALVDYYASTSAVTITWTYVQSETGSQIGAYFSSTVAVKSQ
jgi:hypothetical protein